MNYLDALRGQFIKELKRTERALALTRAARDNAPTAMESKSDESRSRLEGEVAMHELRIKELEEKISLLPGDRKKTEEIDLWSYAEVKLPFDVLHLVIVVEGLGGTKFEEIQCISDKTPIGSALMGKKQGDKFSFNGTRGEVLLVG